MGFTSVLTRQWSSPSSDESAFQTASLVFATEYVFAASPEEVWDLLDSEVMFEWLPFPGVGVAYPSRERGVGVVREMGTVGRPFRFLWIQREEFWRHERPRRMSYNAVSGNWMYTLLVRNYAEDITLSGAPGGGTKLTWTVATTLRYPLRFTKYMKPIWRLAYRLNFGRPVAKRLERNNQHNA